MVVRCRQDFLTRADLTAIKTSGAATVKRHRLFR